MSTLYWNNISISDETKKRRSQIKNLMDEFMDFQWQGYSAFENFGAFIINDKKGSLKFYNGPGFSNEYSKPQFEQNCGELMGVNFNRQTISFTIGVYWISVEHYRHLINWLDPLTTSYILFDFEPNYRYNVKLSKIGDSTRWIVGRENGKPMYYTELQLTFELQGAQCAKGMYSYEWYNGRTENAEKNKWWYNNGKYELKILQTPEFIESDLKTPFILNLNLRYNPEERTTDYDNLELFADYVYNIIGDNGQEVEHHENIPLLSVSLGDLVVEDNSVGLDFDITYDSEVGLLYLSTGDRKKLLTSLTTTDTGVRIVKSYAVNKFYIPGKFEWSFNYSNFKLELKWTRGTNAVTTRINNSGEVLEGILNTSIECYPRTNII